MVRLKSFPLSPENFELKNSPDNILKSKSVSGQGNREIGFSAFNHLSDSLISILKPNFKPGVV